MLKKLYIEFFIVSLNKLWVPSEAMSACSSLSAAISQKLRELEHFCIEMHSIGTDNIPKILMIHISWPKDFKFSLTQVSGNTWSTSSLQAKPRVTIHFSPLVTLG